jgi:hypothetical protein
MRSVRSRIICLLCALAMLALRVPLDAHHSASAYYDIKKSITLDGVVSRVFWKNPHVFFFVDVKEPNGRVSTWSLECQSADALFQMGWRKSDVKVGTRVSVDVMPAVVSPLRGRVRVLRYGGRELVDFGPLVAGK